MKQLFFAFTLLLAASGVTAQNRYMAPMGVFEKDGTAVVENPTTQLVVDLTVEKEVVLCGPYARYAQKFFGVRAPLTDKTTYTLTGASIALDDAEVAKKKKHRSFSDRTVVSSHSRSNAEFARIQPDKTDMIALPLEDAAREAATAIFSLRKNRMELITGDAGENVFGAGLKAALAEIERLEQDYLELFLGKRIVTTQTSCYQLRPMEEKRQYILCRFSVDQGIVSENDLSGEIVMVQITPSGDTPCPYEATRKDMTVVTYRIADPSECAVLCGNRVMTKAVLPIFEFGRTAKIAVPRKK